MMSAFRPVGDRSATVEAGPHGGHQSGDHERAALQDAHRLGDGVLEGQLEVDRRQRLLGGCGIGAVLDDGGDQLVLVGEDPEDRALGDARGFGDQLRRDHLAVLQEQRQHGLDDHRPAFVGRQGLGALGPADGRGHGEELT
jgi:hypothetical protein